MDTSILEDIGLTNAEIKIYLALLEIGASSAGPIQKKSGLQNSVTHATLPHLAEKGLISFVKKGQRRIYTAKNPEQILKFIDEKRKKLEVLLPQLIAKQKPIEKQEAEVFVGLPGFKSMMYQFIEDAKKGDEFLFFAFHTKDKTIAKDAYDFYREFELTRQNIGVVSKGISPAELKPLFAEGHWKNLLYVDFPVLSNISIFKNKIIMTPWENKIISFMITSEQLADNYKEYFYSIWNKKKK